MRLPWRTATTTVLAVGVLAGLGIDAATLTMPTPAPADDAHDAASTWSHAVPSQRHAFASPADPASLASDPGAVAAPPHPAGLTPPATVVLDPAWNTGFYTASLVAGDGTSHVAYYADGDGAVMLASCASPCTEPSVQVLAAVPGVGTDIAQIGDRLVVSYMDLDTRTVQLASCPVDDCRRIQRQPVAAVDTVGTTRLAVTPAGDLVVGYPALGNQVAVLRCDGTDCRDGQPLLLDSRAAHLDLAAASDGSVWVASRGADRRVAVHRCTRQVCAPVTSSAGSAAFPAVAVGPDGQVLVSYHAADRHTLRLISCPDEGDSDGGCRDLEVDDTPEVGYFSAVSVSPSGLPLIAHRTESPAGLVMTECRTPDCSQAVHHPVDRRGDPGHHLSVATGSDGLPRLAHHDGSSRTLRLTSCGHQACAAPAGSEHGGLSVSVGAGADGTPLVAWRHPDTLDLRLSRCPGGPCEGGLAVDSGGDVGLQPTLTVARDDRMRILHQDARDGGLRMVTCAPGCDDRGVSAVPADGWASRLTSQQLADGTTALVASSRHGTVRVGRCAQPGCDRVAWTTVGAGRANGPLAAAAAGAGGGVAVAFADDRGAVLVRCTPQCRTLRLGAEPVTAIDVADTGEATVAVLRDVEGSVSLWRCDDAGCGAEPAARLAGAHVDVAVAAEADRVTVATLAADGTVEVLRCAGTCASIATFAHQHPAWDIDLHRHDGRDVLATLGTAGPWVATCDADGCTAESTGAQAGGGLRTGFVSSQ